MELSIALDAIMQNIISLVKSMYTVKEIDYDVYTLLFYFIDI